MELHKMNTQQRDADEIKIDTVIGSLLNLLTANKPITKENELRLRKICIGFTSISPP